MENDGFEIDHPPKSFSEVSHDLKRKLKEFAPHRSQDRMVVTLRDIRIDHAESMLELAKDARANSSSAWRYLTEAAEAIGYLHASRHTIYQAETQEDRRARAQKNGRAGGTAKGDSGKKVIEDIVKKIIDADPPIGGWDTDSLKEKYYEITDDMEGFNNAEKKFKVISERDDIKSLLSTQKNR